MRLEVNRPAKAVDVINDKTGEKLSWNAGSYHKTRFADVENPFREINLYISTLSAEEKETLWQCYVAASETFRKVNSPDALSQRLSDVMSKIYSTVTMEKLHSWAWKGMTAVMPDSEQLGEPDPDHPEEGTYDRNSYYDLLVLSIALQLAVPIWGEYVDRVQHSVGRVLKELAAFELLSNCPTIIHDKAMAKLTHYVSNFLSGQPASSSANLSGLSAERLPEWLLGSVIVRRLAIGEVDATDSRGHLVSNIYTSMSGMVKDLTRKSGGRFRARSVEEDTNRDEGNTTIADLTQVRQDLSAGQMMIYESAISNYIDLAKQIEPDITKVKVHECVKASVHREFMTRSLFHEAVCQYVLDGTITPQVVPRLDPHMFMILSGVCQAVLWHRGHYSLAVYLTAVGIPLDPGTAAGIDIKQRPSARTVDRLIELYPATQPAHQAPVDGGVDRRMNVAVKAIRAVVGDLAKYRLYQVTCPDGLWEVFPMETASKKIPVVHDVAECFGKLMIELQEGAENNAS